MIPRSLPLVAVLLLGTSFARADVLPPWACNDANVQPGDRELYLESLRSSSLALLQQNLDEVGRYENIYDRDPATLEAGDPLLLAAQEQRASLARLMAARVEFRELVHKRSLIDSHAARIQAEVLYALEWSDRDAAKNYITMMLEDLESWGFVLVQDGRTLARRDPVDPADGRYYIDVDTDIRDVIGAPESCRLSGRLAQIEAAVNADSDRVRALARAAEIAAPILDVEVEVGSWLYVFSRTATVGELVRTPTVSDTDLWGLMRIALAQIRLNIAEEQRRISQLPTADLTSLAEAPLVRADVLDQHPELQGADCVVANEIGWEELRFALVYAVGGVAMVGASIFGGPELAPVMVTALSAVLLGVGIVDTVRQYRLYREAVRLRQSSVLSHGLLTTETVDGYYRGFLLTLGFTLADGLLTVAQAWRVFLAGSRDVVKVGAAKNLDRRQLAELGPDDLRRVILGEELSESLAARMALTCW